MEQANLIQWLANMTTKIYNMPRGGVINVDGKIVMTALFLFYDDCHHCYCHALNGMMI